MISEAFIIETLQKLVRINSVNPSLESGGGGEEEIGMFIVGLLHSMGIEAIVDELEPGRINVTATIEGIGSGPSLMLNAHMDTVGVAGMERPYSGDIMNGKLYGRGSYDMKGSIAAILAVAKAMKENGIVLKGDLLLSFVADEEYESKGAQSLVRTHAADAAIVTEPTNLHICLAHRGFGVFEILTKGRTAHGGNHHLGVDANMKMGLLLSKLHDFSTKLSSQKAHPLCGQASLHVPMVEGGRSLFIYSNECRIKVERRTIPGESESQVTSELQDLIDQLTFLDPGFSAVMEKVIWRSPYEISPSSVIVREIQKAGSSIKNFPQHLIGHTWWEDSAIFGEAGIETVIFGPKGGGIHEEVEWVEIDSVVDLAKILFITSQNYCGIS